MNITVSFGEVFDKLTILQLKSQYITDVTKKKYVLEELNIVNAQVSKHIDKIRQYYNALLEINNRIWILCDKLRPTAMNTHVPINNEYAKTCIEIICENDKRFRMKNIINLLLDSQLKEQKSYMAKILWIVNEVSIEFLQKHASTLIQLSAEYDCINMHCTSQPTAELEQMLKQFPAICICSSSDKPLESHNVISL